MCPSMEVVMHHRKKGGQRKDKKMERMREGESFNKGMAHEPKPTTDQWDVMPYKPGSERDDNRHRPYPPK